MIDCVERQHEVHRRRCNGSPFVSLTFISCCYFTTCFSRWIVLGTVTAVDNSIIPHTAVLRVLPYQEYIDNFTKYATEGRNLSHSVVESLSSCRHPFLVERHSQNEALRIFTLLRSYHPGRGNRQDQLRLFRTQRLLETTLERIVLHLWDVSGSVPPPHPPCLLPCLSL